MKSFVLNILFFALSITSVHAENNDLFNTNPNWFHVISKQYLDHFLGIHRYILEDESIWILLEKNWNVGDQILLTYDPDNLDYVRGPYLQKVDLLRKRFELFNVTKNQFLRAGIYSFDLREENVLKIVGFSDFYTTVVLGNGVRLHFEQTSDQLPVFSHWTKGQGVMLVSRPGAPHCIINLNTLEIASDAEILP